MHRDTRLLKWFKAFSCMRSSLITSLPLHRIGFAPIATKTKRPRCSSLNIGHLLTFTLFILKNAIHAYSTTLTKRCLPRRMKHPMKTKTYKPKPTNEPEKRFYRFAKALIAVPKKEIDKELAKETKHSKKTT